MHSKHDIIKKRKCFHVTDGSVVKMSVADWTALCHSMHMGIGMHNCGVCSYYWLSTRQKLGI